MAYIVTEQVLVNLTGTQSAPVKNVKLTNVRYTAAAPTYMERHGVPSAGDWALDRFAAVFLQGTEQAYTPLRKHPIQYSLVKI